MVHYSTPEAILVHIIYCILLILQARSSRQHHSWQAGTESIPLPPLELHKSGWDLCSTQTTEARSWFLIFMFDWDLE